jgi:phage shock protein C
MIERKGELYRNTKNGKVAGVCAGIADYFGWETWLIRILVVSGILFGMPFLILGYVAAWFILDKKSEVPGSNSKYYHSAASNSSQYENTSKQGKYEKSNESIKVKARIWQSGEPPKQAFRDISRKFSSLEKQLQTIEHYVTSSEFTVAREINKL